MASEESRALEELVSYVKSDARLAGESWSSLTYWTRGVGVSLRRFKYYSEHFRLSGNVVDFHLYIGLRDNLVVFNALLQVLPRLLTRLREKYPLLQMEFRSEPALDAATNQMKDSMAMAHFYVPLQDRDMLRDVFCELYATSQGLDKGHEARPRGARTKDILEDCDFECLEPAYEGGSSEPIPVMRPIPLGVQYADGALPSHSVGGVVSWVTTVEDLFDRSEITLSDGRKMVPGGYVIPPY